MPPRARRSAKPPQQERSKATFEAILLAATRVFSSKGYEAATMAEIATMAGVAIGSLYQYAPTKHELAARVMKRRSSEIAARLDEYLPTLGGLPLAQAVPAALRVVIEGHRAYARMPNLALHELPSEGSLSGLRRVERGAAIGLRTYLEAHRDELRVQNLNLAATLLIHMTDAAVHAAMANNAAWLESDELLEELTRIWLGYLARSA